MFGALAITRYYRRRFDISVHGEVALLFAVLSYVSGSRREQTSQLPALAAALFNVYRYCDTVEESAKHFGAFAGLYLMKGQSGALIAPHFMIFTALPQLIRRPVKLKEYLTLFRVACGPAYVITAVSYGYQSLQTSEGLGILPAALCCSLALLAGTVFRPDNTAMLKFVLGRNQIPAVSVRKRIHAVCMVGSLLSGILIWSLCFTPKDGVEYSAQGRVNPWLLLAGDYRPWRV